MPLACGVPGSDYDIAVSTPRNVILKWKTCIVRIVEDDEPLFKNNAELA